MGLCVCLLYEKVIEEVVAATMSYLVAMPVQTDSSKRTYPGETKRRLPPASYGLSRAGCVRGHDMAGAPHRLRAHARRPAAPNAQILSNKTIISDYEEIPSFFEFRAYLFLPFSLFLLSFIFKFIHFFSFVLEQKRNEISFLNFDVFERRKEKK